MPQMAPLYWLYLFVFFLLTFFIFLTLNYFIKPFEKVSSPSSSYSLEFKNWKL
uniref:ATP synthase complex subunit 8 n=1 Tax=Grapsus tenuicrustatus TaxID=1036995 RepID=A0A140GM96_9EUCA|nr:ATP synthase F0 subunit 8 [Grapsus tenuicrustatus]AMN14532.1 ATP synthase F0 subunit 8 [Grapsus tenuicrustatus]